MTGRQHPGHRIFSKKNPPSQIPLETLAALLQYVDGDGGVRLESHGLALFAGSEGDAAHGSETEHWTVHARLSPSDVANIAAESSNASLRLDPTVAVAYLHAPEDDTRPAGKREIIPVNSGKDPSIKLQDPRGVDPWIACYRMTCRQQKNEILLPASSRGRSIAWSLP